jgi:hypothetical protein
MGGGGYPASDCRIGGKRRQSQGEMSSSSSLSVMALIGKRDKNGTVSPQNGEGDNDIKDG